ncbi:TraB/GumN family protein [uncultured Clostridium sp.]|uniref:TraB/GumN family protein n=1 Tax=uncultured Clostridium sp. TaxID=59620 RepID=UPI002628A799|nr:TraB/GumN family protein [uncultured Clostridium sp.]
MRGIKKKALLICMSVFFVLGSFIGCGAENKKEDTKEIAQGYQWEVTKDGKTLYLIGTMHPIDTSYNYFSEKIEEIISKTDVLSVEVNPTQEDAVLANAMMVYSNGKNIESDLEVDEVKTLKRLCKDAGLDYEKLKVFTPLGISQNISAVIYQKANLVMATFDDMLIERYSTDGKEVDQVENMKFQMELLNKIQGKDALKEMLQAYEEGSFEELSEESVEYAKNVMEAYKKGEEDFMNEAIEMQKENPDTYKALILDRNKGMVEKIEEYINSDKSYVVAVGALHFFGEDGVVKMLEDKGYTVKKG